MVKGGRALDIGRIFDRGFALSVGGTVRSVSASALPPAARVTLRPAKGVAVYPLGISLFKSGSGGRRGPGGVRGRITRFSPASRRRLRSFILSHFDSSFVSSRKVGWVTLTSRSGTAAGLKVVFQTVIKRLRRRYRGFTLVWRLEYQKRGIPHFHILVVSSSAAAVHSICRDLIRFWVGLTDSSFLGQNFKWVRSVAGLALYITDMGKMVQSDPGDDSPGRWWGVVNAGYLPVIYPLVLYGAVFYVEAARFFRSLRRSRSRRCRRKKKWRGLGLRSEFFSTGFRFVKYLVSVSLS